MNMQRFPVALMMLAWSTAADAVTSEDAARHAREVRGQALHLSGAGADAADLQRAVDLLEGNRRDLGAAERDNGSPSLRLEGYSDLLPLASAYSRLGRKQPALAVLEQANAAAWLPAGAAYLADSAFDGLRDEPRFKAVAAVASLPSRLWKGPASATPYKDVLTVEERVAGLSLFWAEARQNFVFFDRVPELDWDQVYLDYLTKVMSASTTRDYYAVMRELAPLLKDGHTNIVPPGELSNEFWARPPLRTVLAEGRVLVRHVDDAALAARVQVGEEVLAIDGVPVRRYAEQRIYPLVSAGAPQDRDFQAYTVQLLNGRAADPVRLRLQRADGSEHEESLARSGGYHWPEAHAFRMLADGVAYIAIEQFTDDSGLKAFEAALPQIMRAHALIIDMRRNGGGNGEVGLKILSYLSKAPIPGAVSTVRGADNYLRASSGSLVSWTPLPAGRGYVQAREQVYAGPVALLTGPQTYSAGEDFAVSFSIMKRGAIIGEATGGSTGQAINFTLPGGGLARVCAKRDVLPDGRGIVGVGVAPDIEVKLTVEALRGKRDAVLERAVQWASSR
jgi:C-terminal processing protease CtpA/Prc